MQPYAAQNNLSPIGAPLVYPPPVNPAPAAPETPLAVALRDANALANAVHQAGIRLETLLDKLRGAHPQAVEKASDSGGPATLPALAQALGATGVGVSRVHAAIAELESLLG